MFKHHAYCTFPDFRGISFGSVHYSILSRNGVSDIPGAIQGFIRLSTGGRAPHALPATRLHRLAEGLPGLGISPHNAGTFGYTSTVVSPLFLGQTAPHPIRIRFFNSHQFCLLWPLCLPHGDSSQCLSKPDSIFIPYTWEMEDCVAGRCLIFCSRCTTTPLRVQSSGPVFWLYPRLRPCNLYVEPLAKFSTGWAILGSHRSFSVERLCNTGS